MILSCPQCNAQFSAPDREFVKRRRRVECGVCGYRWFVAPLDSLPAAAPASPSTASPPPVSPPMTSPPAAAPDPGAPPPPTPVGAAVEPTLRIDDSNEPPKPPHATRRRPHGLGGRRRRSGGGLSWLAFLSLFALGAAALALYSEEIIELWPPAARYYALVGLSTPEATPVPRLEFRDVSARIAPGADGEQIIIAGDIANLAHEVQPVPEMQIRLDGTGPEPLAEWTFQAAEFLVRGEVIGFETAHPAPDETAVNATIIFAGESVTVPVAADESPPQSESL